MREFGATDGGPPNAQALDEGLAGGRMAIPGHRIPASLPEWRGVLSLLDDLNGFLPLH
ncbi:MAG: hypothetical protein ACKN9W_20540 [Methylococcus sp.]